MDLFKKMINDFYPILFSQKAPSQIFGSDLNTRLDLKPSVLQVLQNDSNEPFPEGVLKF